MTAGGSGIGHAIAGTLIEHGARVVICDISDAIHSRQWEESLKGVIGVKADVSRDEDVDAMFDTVARDLGAVRCARQQCRHRRADRRRRGDRPADWRRCIDICLTGQFLCARHAVPMLKAAGGGSIVNMSSAAGRFGYAFRTPYSAAKWGVIGFTQSLAKELGPDNIRVNAILPGIVEGPRIDGVIEARAKQLGLSQEEMTAKYLDKVSLRRMVWPYDVSQHGRHSCCRIPGKNISGQSLSVERQCRNFCEIKMTKTAIIGSGFIGRAQGDPALPVLDASDTPVG